MVKKSRLEWLDALRGFTMILVVAFHVSFYGFSHSAPHSASLPILMLFRMPLFFFISGFLAYKASQTWTLPILGNLLLKKIRIQVVPTVIFFTLCMAVLHSDWISAWWPNWNDPTKHGYWFTIALLYMFIVYYIFAYLEQKLKWSSWIPITLLMILSLCCYESCYLPRTFSWALGYRGEPNYWVVNSSLRQMMINFPFFLFGNIIHRCWSQAQRLIDSRWFFPLLVLVAIVSCFDYIRWHYLLHVGMEWANLSQTIAKFSMLLIVFIYFRHYQDSFTNDKFVGRALQYIGKRTLDIYLLHFLLMPQLPEVGAFFKTHPHNFIADTVLSVTFALLVIGCCLIVSNILRISPFLKKYLFGRS